MRSKRKTVGRSDARTLQGGQGLREPRETLEEERLGPRSCRGQSWHGELELGPGNSETPHAEALQRERGPGSLAGSKPLRELTGHLGSSFTQRKAVSSMEGLQFGPALENPEWVRVHPWKGSRSQDAGSSEQASTLVWTLTLRLSYEKNYKHPLKIFRTKFLKELKTRRGV